jgi:hypothetical protein
VRAVPLLQLVVSPDHLFLGVTGIPAGTARDHCQHCQRHPRDETDEAQFVN